MRGTGILIIGDGVAGMTAALTVRAHEPEACITLLSADPQPYYYRAALTNYLLGELSDDELWALPPRDWEALRLERVCDRAEALEPAASRVRLVGGRYLDYDRLLLACGARARRPSESGSHGVPGAGLDGVCTIRTLHDVQALLARLPDTRSAVVLGGGILGLEVAEGLLARQCEVTLVHRGATLLERVVDFRAGELIRLRSERRGVAVRTGQRLAGIEGTGGRVTGVRLGDGSAIPCRLVIACIGTEPATEWLEGSGVALENGLIPVDRTLRVAGFETILAAGDAVRVDESDQPWPNPGGLWQPAQYQGRVAGRNLCAPPGQPRAEYRPGVLLNATRAWGLSVDCAGCHPEAGGESIVYEAQIDGRPVYKRAVFRDGALAGFLLLGERREAHALVRLLNLRQPPDTLNALGERLFDPGFDLFAWVAAQERDGRAERWRDTALLPNAPIVGRRRSGGRLIRRLALDQPLPVDREPVDARTPLVLDEGGHRLEFGRGPVIVGDHPRADYRLAAGGPRGARFICEPSGEAWLIHSGDATHPVRLNGRPVLRPSFLDDLDVVMLGDWKAIVRLPRPADRAEEQAIGPAALLQDALARFALPPRPLTRIGRSADNDIVLDEAGIDFFHAQLQLRDGDWFAIDAGGGRGVSVNGERLVVPQRLRDGDTLGIGPRRLRFGLDTAAAKRPVAAPAPGGRSACLVCEHGPLAPRALALHAPATIGRDPQAGLRLADPLLSRLHARIEQDGSGFRIIDLGSLNGTRVAGRRLEPERPARLAEGDRVEFGQGVYRFHREPPVNRLLVAAEQLAAAVVADAATRLFGTPEPRPAAPPSVLLQPVGALLEAHLDTLRLDGTGPFILGRPSRSRPPPGEGECYVDLDLEGVSRRHARIEFHDGRFRLSDAGSTLGIRLNGEPVDAAPRTLAVGDRIELAGTFEFRFVLQAGTVEAPAVAVDTDAVDTATVEAAAVDTAESPAPRSGFRIDWLAGTDPLDTDLERRVAQELDACIGCHACMRACPLPESATVTIAALNNLALQLGEPGPTAARFVTTCTQCEACVPVCPVNIQRSRIVLWNKLKAAPDPDRGLLAQTGAGTQPLPFTLRRLAAGLAEHGLLGELGEAERIELLGQGRFRRLADGESLVAPNSYPDALWLILEGELELGLATAERSFVGSITLGIGQTVAEHALLADQPVEYGVRARGEALVVGFAKYSLLHFARVGTAFREALEALYVEHSVLQVLRRDPALAAFGEGALQALAARLEVDRYPPGRAIAAGDGAMIGLVTRGFVRELRERDGRTVTANYLKPADRLLGDPAAATRWEALTLCEVAFLPETGRAGLADALLAALRRARPVAMTAAGHERLHEVIHASELMVIDTRRCVDCDNCVAACARRHGHTRLDRRGRGFQIGPYQIPGSCYHCADPKCLLCAVDGIVRRPDGEIGILAENCIGCGACAERCPYDNIRMVPREPARRPVWSDWLPESWRQLLGRAAEVEELPDHARIAIKCDLCAGHADGPACVRSCPTGAARRVDPLSLFTGEPSR